MAREKKPVHKVIMTEENAALFNNCFKSMTFNPQKIFRKH